MSMHPELSILIPTYNEAEQLPFLLADLALQRDVRCEIIICDGDSDDGTVIEAEKAVAAFTCPVRVVRGPAGRPAQLIRGAAMAAGPWLMILHADSRLPSRRALRTALDRLNEAAAWRGDATVAGRFQLSFTPAGDLPGHALSYLAAKARLNRPGCIHGDQGLMLATDRCRALLPLFADIPMLAETRLADRMLREGAMLLFPDEIITSSRRFQAEGLAARQTVNALIMNFAEVEWPQFFTTALPLYRAQREAGTRLNAGAMLHAIHDLLCRESPAERRRLWSATGAYVAANAWQLAFRCDVRRAAPAFPATTPCLDWYDRHLAPRVSSLIGQRLAQWLTWCWFHLQRQKNG